eukprot:7237375-Alexandrium_andersonii.AAC.1
MPSARPSPWQCARLRRAVACEGLCRRRRPLALRCAGPLGRLLARAQRRARASWRPRRRAARGDARPGN